MATTFFFFFCFNAVLEFNCMHKKLPRVDELNEISRISAITFEAAQLHFLSDIFVPVTIVVGRQFVSVMYGSTPPPGLLAETLYSVIH